MVAAESLKGVQIDFKGGLVGMAVKKRQREGLATYPSTELWRFPEFKDGVERMNKMQPPKVPEKIIRDLGDGVCPPPSMDIVTGGDDGHTRATPPVSQGASCGGPSAPIDPELAELKNLVEKAALREQLEVLQDQAAARQRERAAATGAATTPTTTDGKVSAIESIDLDAQCMGCVVVNVTGTWI